MKMIVAYKCLNYKKEDFKGMSPSDDISRQISISNCATVIEVPDGEWPLSYTLLKLLEEKHEGILVTEIIGKWLVDGRQQTL